MLTLSEPSVPAGGVSTTIGPSALVSHKPHEIERIGAPVEGLAPVNYLTGFAACLAHLVVHEQGVDRRHCPNDGLDRALLDGPVGLRAVGLGGRQG